MDDLISRQAVIEMFHRVANIGWNHGIETTVADAFKEAAEMVENLPTAEPTLYGYKIEHLAYIATVMEKEGVTAEYAVRTFDDIGRVVKMLIEEVQAKVEEALNERFN